VRTLVAGPNREANYIADSGVFPPTFSPLRDVHPLTGDRLPPATEPAGGTEHRRILPNSYAACAVPPGAKLGRRCPLPRSRPGSCDRERPQNSA
jgi:hypothetical protein